MSKLDEVIKNINGKLKNDILTTNIDAITFKGKEEVPYSTPALTRLFHGGHKAHTLFCFSGDFSSGKAQPMYSKLLTENGWITFNEVRIGTKVYGDDGKLHEVIGVFPQGKKPIYEVTFTDGATCRCSDEHLWQYNTRKLRENGSEFVYVKELKDILLDFKSNPKKQSSYIFPTNNCIEFPRKELKIDPYILGLLLGDGSLNKSPIRFTNTEDDILKQFADYVIANNMEYTYEVYKDVPRIIVRKSSNQRYKECSYIKYWLRKYGLGSVTSSTKFIPNDYLFSDEVQRLKLLAGLVNTDGCVTDHIDYTSCSKQLILDIIQLCRSLGIRVSELAPDHREGRNICYRLSISLDDRLYPYLSIKHQGKWAKNSMRDRRLRYIKTIKYIGEEECQCIYIDSESHLYITDDYCVTHNTSTAMAIAADFQKYYKKKWEDRVVELQAIEKPTKNEKQELATLLDNGYKKVAFIDVECSADSDWASKMGFDMEDVIYCKPQGESAEQLLEIALELIRSDGICLLILDSVAALASAAQTEKTMLEKSYGGVSSAMTVWVSKLLPLLNKHDCSVIAINQLRDTIGSMVPGQTHMPGGRALGYQSHVILNFRKGKALDESYKEIPNKSENYFGQYIEVRVEKNKISKPDIRLTRLHILFDKGLYPLLDVVNLAIDYGIITKSGAWFTFEDEEGNPRIDSEESTMKWQGLTGVVKYFETHEKEYSELFDLVDKKVRENS